MSVGSQKSLFIHTGGTSQHTCKDCYYRERWQYGSKIIQYCSKIKSNRTSNGQKKIKCKNTACGLFYQDPTPKRKSK